jgi:hypothetical protein
MYIGHYKSVSSASEFFSSKRKELDFPVQVEYKGERYLLFTTHIAATKSQESNMKARAKELNIPFGIKLK